ncbi:hypothetical protein [Xanthovirga aplysinae]|uniref:dioxygenase family protein n=1 Tax=Xanthovirga aplysinae TaxID=2529853 RepID=UPI0012BBB4A9|nr:hypothetical protein [Xanthovirga aplysinae]MTI29781.1 hypothetical protein [Xanthovirga aplysinae]
MNKLILFAFIISCFSCSIDRTIVEISEIENNVLIHFQKLPSKSKLKITDKNEPGEKLILCLTFIDKENKRELANQLVKFYHTSTAGKYEQTDPNDESTARLSGQSTTNLKGQIYIETILPGDYGSSDDNRHIHTTVFGAKPKAYDIHFKQYTGYMLNNFINGSDQHFLADLKRTKENALVSFLTIEVKNPDQ